jgi:hypothetical protein
LEEQAMRLVQNYRSIFANLASYFLNYTDSKEKAAEVLRVMNQKISNESIPMDYRMQYNMVLFYEALGETDLLNAQLVLLEKECLKMIEKDPMNITSQWNPYRMLMDIYDISEEHEKHIDILNKILVFYPGDQSVLNRIEEIKKMMSGEVDTTFEN